MEWIKDDVFNEWMREREKEKVKNYDEEWSPKEWGTSNDPKVYIGRFLQDPKGVFYKKFFYHMYQNEASEYVYTLCPKTFDFKDFCPLCFTSSKLYSGSEKDKQLARKYKRNTRYVGNWYLIEDPRDKDVEEPEWTGKVWQWAFPGKVETKLDEELKGEEGIGKRIFDPGSNGFNFIVKVKSISDDRGNTFPNYDSSTFSRKSTPLGTDKEIKTILDSCVPLVDWLNKKNGENNWSRVKESLMEATLWTDALQREWTKHFGVTETDSKSKIIVELGTYEEKDEEKDEESGEVEDISSKEKESEFLKSLDEF